LNVQTEEVLLINNGKMKPIEVLESVADAGVFAAGFIQGKSGRKFDLGKIKLTKDEGDTVFVLGYENRQCDDGEQKNCEWGSWRKSFPAGHWLKVSFWIKFSGSVPPISKNFGVKLHGKLHNDWLQGECTANEWSFVSVVDPCMCAGWRCRSYFTDLWYNGRTPDCVYAQPPVRGV
jgi:hypothetical protein